MKDSVKESDYITVIGGANVDIIGFPKAGFKSMDSMPGIIKVSSGGVGRNIAENLVRMGIYTKLISAIGDDVHGSMIMNQGKTLGLDMNHSLFLNQQSTSTYMAILNDKGDMAAAIAHMDILEHLSIDFIKEKKKIIGNSRLCVIDANVPGSVIEYIVTNITDTVFFLDTVSTSKALKVKDFIGRFHTIKPNKLEAEALSGQKIEDEEDLRRVGEYFIESGVKRVFISLGESGVYYYNGYEFKFLKAPKVEVVNATGAGDAFIAALAYCYLKELDDDYSAKFSMASSIVALSHEDTISPLISVEKIISTMQEVLLC